MAIHKFGSSVLTGHSQLAVAVHDVYRSYRQGLDVVVVVSAMGRHTDLLLDEARQLGEPSDSPAALALLLSTGETQSAALLCMALHRAGVPATGLDTRSLGLVARGDRLDAEPVSVDTAVIRHALESTAVVVVPGFAAVYEDGGLALLGRGGSDLTAAFLAHALDVHFLRLIKDVDGVYEADPAESSIPGEAPHRYGTITYADTMRIAEVLVQPKAVECLEAHGRAAEVTALLHDRGTCVGAAATSVLDARLESPLAVVVLGFGTVGQGVVACLDAMPDDFTIVGIGVRDTYQHLDNPLGCGRLTSSIDELLDREFDVLVELTGNVRFAHPLVERQLSKAKPVVTANKVLVAMCGHDLDAMAAANNTHFAYSAAVGGSTPMLEAVRRFAADGPVTELRGVLNGTCNVILERLTAGMPLEKAIVAAQAEGFSEADPGRDLSGEDAEDKLRILARAAFGARIESLQIERIELATNYRQQLENAKQHGQVVKQIARVDTDGIASVSLVVLDKDDFLAQGTGADCRLLIRGEHGREGQVRGKGAGCWPTSEAVVADLIDLRMAGRRQTQIDSTVASQPTAGVDASPNRHGHYKRLPPA